MKISISITPPFDKRDFLVAILDLLYTMNPVELKINNPIKIGVNLETFFYDNRMETIKRYGYEFEIKLKNNKSQIKIIKKIANKK